MFEYKGQNFTLQQLQDHVKSNSLDFNAYMAKMKGLGMVEKTNEQDPEDVRRENLFDIMPGFKGKAFVTIDNTFKMVKDAFTDKEEREESAEVIVNEINNLKPRALNTLFNKVPALGMDYSRRIFEATRKVPGLKKLQDTLITEEEVVETNKGIKDFLKKQNAQARAVEKYLIKDTGEGIVKGIKQGDLSDFVGGVFRANTAMIETAVPAMLTGGASLPIQIIAPMYMDYNEAKARTLYGDDEDAMDKLIDNDQTEVAIPTALGILATSLEYIGLKGFTKYIFSNAGKSTLAGKLLLSSNREGLTEWGQSGVEAMNRAFAEQKSRSEAIAAMWDTMTSEEGLESYLMGFVGSAGVGGASQAVNKTITRALRSDNASAKTIKDKIDKIAVLNNNKFKTRRQDVKEAIDIEIKKEEAELREYIQERRKVAEILNDDQKNSLIDAINKKDNLRVKLEEVRDQLKNGQISKKEYGYLFRSLNNQDKDLSSEIERVYKEAEQQLLVKSSEDISQIIKETGLKGKVTELTAKEISNLNIKQADQASKEFGFIAQEADGSFEIFLNTDKQMIGTAGHEFLHAVLFKTIKNNKTTQDALGDALVEHVSKLGGDKSVLGERLSAYGEYNKKGVFVRDSNFGEETMTIMSEEILNGNLKFEENFFTKIGDVIRRFSQDYLGRQVIFNRPRDVYNFVKDYTKSIKDGKISPAILRVAKKGAVGKLIAKDVKAKDVVQMSKEASNNVQQLYENRADNPSFEFDIIEQFKPIVGKIVDKRKDAPNFDRQLLTDEIETGQRGILDLIREYNPESGVPLAAYINKFLPARAIEASRRVLGEEFTEDVTEARGVVAEETAEVEVQVKPKEKKTIVAKRLGVSDKAIKAIKKILPNLDTSNLTFKTLKNKVPNIVGELFGISPKKIVNKANLTKSELLSAQMFINKNADLLMAMLPEGATPGGTATGVPNTLLKAFYTKTDRAKAATTGSKAGLAVQRKNKIDKTQFLETFGIIEGKPVRTDRNTSARVLALADMVGKMITNQTVREELAKQPGKEKDITRIAEGKSQTMFSKEIKPKDRADVIKRAKKIKEYADLEKIFDGLLAPKSDVLAETKDKAGKIKVKVITRRDLNQYQDEKNKITWEEFYMNQILDFLDEFPQYYKILSSGLTGGIKKAAFFNIPFFRDSLEYYAEKSGRQNIIKKIDSTEQIGPSRIYYHDKKIFKGLKNIDLSKDEGKIEFLIQFFKDIAKHGKGQEIFQELLTHLGFDQSNFMRHSAVLLAIPVKSKGKNKGKEVTNEIGVEEHDPQMEMARILFAAAQDGNIEDAIKLLKFGYSQSSLRKKDDPVGELRQSRGEDYFEKVVPRVLNNELDFLPDGFGAIYRFMKAGVNPNAYRLIKENQTIAEYFGVDNLSVAKAREAIIGVFEGTQDIEVLRKQRDLNLQNKEDNIKLTKAITVSRTMASKPSKGITILDFDDTLATTKSLVKFTTPEGKTGTLNAEQYASTYQDLLDQGYTFDFSDFNKVVKGKIAPLFQKALKLQSKFGPENMFVLTARPPQAAKAIFDFLKANGLNIPLKNITGLANSTSEAKALWIAEKVGEGYNDFYFADDALQNVQAVKNMLNQFDVKSKVQQARTQFSKNLDTEFNDILENVTGIESKKRFAATKARKRGAGKGKFRFFIPPSHEDFVGLLYNFMGKGRVGDAHRNFFEKALIRPLLRAHREIDTAKQAVANDYKALNKQMPEVRKMLIKKTPDGDFTYQDAIRVYIWDKHGYKIPGLSETDQKSLVNIVKKDPSLRAYAEVINTISKQDTYVDPGPNWETGNIRIDLVDATGRVGRKTYLAEFIENADIIFSEENLNKIEAAYGKNLREALEDMLHRIKIGVNRPKGASAKPNIFMNWLNASVSGVMFFNTRSSLLQQMSNVNYINFADNNIFAAAKAFANQKQYWKDFADIFNSDVLKQRRGGLQTDINGAELAEAIKKARPGNMFDQVAIIIGKALKLGFLPTQIGDNIAIATGGATFYRNRVNKYIKDGLSKKEAETKAFNDFQEITQATQQSAKPYMTSKQQAMWIGKLVLNFLNTPSQYNRIIKKAGSDIKNRRITPPNTTQMQSDMSNMSRILYYGAIQNLIFYGLQTALFAVMFSGEDENEEERIEQFLKKKQRVINGTIDTILRGSGIYGVAVSTLKNMAIKFIEQREPGYNKDESAVVMEMFNFSPVVGIKARRIVNAEKTLNYNMKVIKEMETFDIDNPLWSAVTNYTQTITTAPTNKIYQKTINLRNASDRDYTALQRLMFLSGYTTWSLGLGDTKKMKKIKQDIKDKKKLKERLKTRTTTVRKARK